MLCFGLMSVFTLGLIFYCGAEASVQSLALFQFIISVLGLYGFEFVVPQRNGPTCMKTPFSFPYAVTL